MGYSEDIKNGRWQRKRLEIMQRDNFKCLACKKDDKLNVHHLYYEKGMKIWDYDNDSLVTLCENCHKALHEDLLKVSGIIAFKALIGKFDLTDILDGRLD